MFHKPTTNGGVSRFLAAKVADALCYIANRGYGARARLEQFFARRACTAPGSAPTGCSKYCEGSQTSSLRSCKPDKVGVGACGMDWYSRALRPFYAVRLIVLMIVENTPGSRV